MLIQLTSIAMVGQSIFLRYEGRTLTVNGFRLEDEATGERDPGQELI